VAQSEAELQKGEIKPTEIEILDTLGAGSSATVYLGIYNKSKVAVKVMKYTKDSGTVEDLIREASLMTALSHTNVVSYIGSYFKEPDIYIVTELMQRGDLFAILHNDDIVMETPHRKRFGLDVARGMAYLHSRNVIHRDLKTFNLLVTSDWVVKVSDFGLSKVIIDTTAQKLTACGTTAWAAPEVLRQQVYSLKADVFSYGVCLWEIVTREEPFEGLNAVQVVMAVAVEKQRLPIPANISKNLNRLITACWQENPDDRPTFDQVIQTLESIECAESVAPSPWSKKEENQNYQTPDQSDTDAFLSE